MLRKILDKNEENVQVKFLRKKDNASLLYYTDQPEIYFVDIENIIIKLPKPKTLEGARAKEHLYFFILISVNTSVRPLLTKYLTSRLIRELINQLVDYAVGNLIRSLTQKLKIW